MERLRFSQVTAGDFAYVQTVPAAGYEWCTDFRHMQDGQFYQDEAPWLVGPEAVKAGEPDHEWQRYAPLRFRHRLADSPNLHRLFAELDATKAAVLTFANQYGQLGGAGARLGRGNGKIRQGEPLEYWAREIQDMRAHLNLWEWVQHGDRRALRDFKAWEDSRPAQVRPFIPVEAWDPHTAALTEHWGMGESIPTSRYLYALVSDRMRGHVHPTILPFEERRIFHVPDSLVAALYVVFALELSGQSLPARTCAAADCLKRYVPSGGKSRFCSDTCRKRTHARQKRRGKS